MGSSTIADALNCANQGEIDGNGCAFPGFPICRSFDQVDYGVLCYLKSMHFRFTE